MEATSLEEINSISIEDSPRLFNEGKTKSDGGELIKESPRNNQDKCALPEEIIKESTIEDIEILEPVIVDIETLRQHYEYPTVVMLGSLSHKITFNVKEDAMNAHHPSDIKEDFDHNE